MILSRIQIVLGAVCLGLAGVVAAIEVLPDPKQPDGALAERDPARKPIANIPPEPLLSELKSRPPFWQDRRVPAPLIVPAALPPPAPLPPPPPPPPPSSELTLVGIVNGPEGRIAVLRLRSNGKLERHIEGDAIDQWALKRILVDRVIFVGGGSETELSFPPPGERKTGQSSSTNQQRAPFAPVPISPAPHR